jgi:ATP-binding cassette subfamily B protein
MRPWQFVLRMAGFRIWLFLGSGLFASVLFYALPLLPGLVVREIFQRLAPESGDHGMQWPLLALLVGIGVGRMAGLIAASWTETSVHLYVGALLRRNMLAHVLRRPGARAVPFSSGEAISRFRDDVDVACGFLTWTLDPIGQITVIVLAIVLLAAVDPILTLGVFVPLVAVIVIARVAGSRRRTRKPSGQ